MADQLEVEADKLQAGHQREEERKVVMTADQSVPDREKKAAADSHNAHQHDLIAPTVTKSTLT